MRRRIELFGILILLAIPLRSSSQSVENADALNPYAIYSALLEDLFVREEIRLIVIRKETKEFEDLEEIKRLQALWGNQYGLTEETVKSFLEQNDRNTTLESKFNLSVQIVILEKREFDRYFEKRIGGWKDFFRKYPDSTGLIAISNIGVDAASGRALIYVEQICGPRCGSGRLVLLKLLGGQWKVAAVGQLWVS